jgi:Zn-dependent protease/CBS domain-containing protein
MARHGSAPDSLPAAGPRPWSWTIGTIAGIRISVHATFPLLVIWFAAVYWFEVKDVALVASGVALLLLLFGCVLLHEMGHALAAQRFGFMTREITLLPIGGIASLERMPDDPRQSLWITLAGPAVNVVIAAALFVALRLSGTWQPIVAVSLTRGPFLERLMLLNVSLLVFNMLPAFPMDGGRALRALLATRLDDRRATRIAARLGQAMAVLFALVGWFANPLLILIALFVWTGAAQEAAAADLQAVLRGVPVARAMRTSFRALAPDEPLSVAVDLVQQEGQHEFPVVAKERLVGLLTRRGLLRALASAGPGRPVADAMEREFIVVSPDEMLDAALRRFGPRQPTTAAVVWNGQLVGLLTPEAVAEFVSFQDSLDHAA